MIHDLTPLPYDKKALSPHISPETIDLHYGKHHQAYVTNLNTLLNGHPFSELSLEDVIMASYEKEGLIFNQAAQVWNHTFYWSSMHPQGGGTPQGVLFEKLCKKFGSVQGFFEAFKTLALGQFGSGWAWLVSDSQGELDILKTSNADLPMVHGYKALLTCDVWEHAYYVDYQNRRAAYVDAFLSHLINWKFAETNYVL